MLCVLTAFISVIFMETLSFDDGVWKTPTVVVSGQVTDSHRTIRSATKEWLVPFVYISNETC